MSVEAVMTIIAGALSTLCIAAICGLVLMYRQVGQLQISVEHFGRALEDFAQEQKDDRGEARADRATIHRRIDELTRQLR